MKTRRTVILAAAILAACLAALSGLPRVMVAESLPARLADQEYWKLIADFSEPNGTFRSDNLLSNERWLQYVIPDLTRTAKAGRVYMGVGPEQNFTYITALKPKMAFIVDVRRGNLHLHLMYKALFELAVDRADFMAKLFSKKRPSGLSPKSTVTDIVTAYWNLDETRETLYKENLKAMFDLLATKHGFALSEEDRQGIEYVYHAFFWNGPSINYNSSTGAGGGFGAGSYQPTYADLLVATDMGGQMRGFLATEENFAFMKDLETKNLLVPVVGNFAGPRAIRAIGKYLKEKGATVSAFYLSNVEQYLMRENGWHDFCSNVATLPLDETSTFIRATRGGGFGGGGGLSSELGGMLEQVKPCAAAAQRQLPH
jgi:hypothetical protein